MTNFKTGGPWITRFAPSPTGALHLGNVRTAILNFLLARQSGGKFLLRLEDTDRERSTFAAEADILWSLAWLGLTPDEPVRHQSLRLALYTKAAQILVDKDLAYPCFCTEAQLEQDREEAARKGLPPRYAGRCRDLSPQERQERLECGQSHVIRFRNTATENIDFTDLIKGDMSIPPDAFGDFVLLRSNGWPSYNFAVVVDDADMDVNLVLRGEDHLTNTARQILLYRAFGYTPPSFAHHGLMVDAEGKKLSKRTGAISVPQCHHLGLQPQAVVQYLAGLSGALPAKRLFSSLEEMAAAFQPFALGRGNAVMNMEELRALSARFFRALAPAELAQNLILPEADPWHALTPQIQEELAGGLRENAADLQELRALLPYFTAEEVAYTPEVWNELAVSRPVLAALEELLSALEPEAQLNKEQASAMFKQTSHAAGVKGRALYHPIRLALMGSASGPELAVLMMLLPAGRIVRRLRAVLKFFSNHQG